MRAPRVADNRGARSARATGNATVVMSLYLIRHGETALNAARVVQPVDTPLSARGLQQADALAARIGQLGAAAIVASPLPRALRTAHAIGAACGLPVAQSELLEERNFGAWRGLPYDALGPGAIATPDAPPGGESMAAFEARVARAFDAIVALRATLGGPLAVVTHGLVVRTLVARHLALPAGTTLPARIGNASLTIAAAQPPHAVTLLDCTLHLAGALSDDASGLSGA